MVSVIITAFNRRDFLVEAVKSVLNQKVDPGKYEIIVTKNFLDANIDGFLKENNLISIVDEKPGMGYRLSRAIEIARGDVICFLQDDDLWLDGKLQNVLDEFMIGKLGVLRNGVIKIDGDGHVIKSHCGSNRRILKVQGNTTDSDRIRDVFVPCGKGLASSLSISKELMIRNNDVLAKIFFTIDDWITYCCLDSEDEYRAVPYNLTAFRVHESESHYSKPENSEARKVRFLMQVVNDQDLMIKELKSSELRKFVMAERARNYLLYTLSSASSANVRAVLYNSKLFIPFILINRNLSNLVVLFFGFAQLLVGAYAKTIFLALLRSGVSSSI